MTYWRVWALNTKVSFITRVRKTKNFMSCKASTGALDQHNEAKKEHSFPFKDINLGVRVSESVCQSN